MFLRLTGVFRNAHLSDVEAQWRQWPNVRAFTGPAMVAFVYFDSAGTAQDYVLSEK